MSARHPIISVTGSSGAGTTSVRNTFEQIFRREDVRAVFTEVMAHRVFLEPVHELQRGAIVPALCRAAFETVPAP